ncbi:uncharacterized protein E0L32_008121 [Thyridium curvatum]|uniref:PhoD-like phosphatase metallophosphatase domain-containing protein n=1 Tax=Thyridium curvatum TaxID=1093900 RepID=A0A507AKC5_9PEZI|nr:uncharacterized protein E0L32_008121 [Thyridium curvatum]TPX10915.1 hypothetical protein E0L32_008121 [Thyridium curvatum]
MGTVTSNQKHQPAATAVFTLFAIYVPAFILSKIKQSPYEIVDDEIDIVVKETTVRDGSAEDDAPVVNGDKRVVEENVDIQEIVTMQPKPPHILKTLLVGTPSPRSLLLSLLTLAINIACVAMVADRVFSEHSYTADDLSFIRVGYVSDTEARLLIREPDQAKMPISVKMHIKDPHPPFDNPQWQSVGGVRWTAEETDYTAVLSIPIRHGSQRTYEWVSSNNHSGEFTAAPKPGHTPDIHGGQFTFLSTSCIVSRLPYNPLDHPLAIPGLRHLANVLPSLGAQFMLFLGDFIYVDVPRWWGKGVEDYRQKYRQVYASPDWQAVGQNLSWIHVLDDHEIRNDWDANSTGVYHNATEPYNHYQAAANPPPARWAGRRSAAALGAADPATTTYFEFTQGPASFFLLDTRSYRSSNAMAADDPAKTMLGARQLGDLLAFLARPEPRGVKWKIVASSVPFTKNWRVNTRDTWGGFPAERRRVLEAMWDAGARRGVGVVVLSGDRHEFAATRFPPPAGDDRWGEGAAVHEFSASPLSQFYSPVPTYWQTDDEDVKLKYINKGNSKFGAITIETLAEGDQSSLKYRLFVDGVETWNTVVLSPAPTLEGSSVGKSLWDRLRGL